MVVELAASLSNLPKIGSPDPDDVKCETVADIVKLVGQQEVEKTATKQDKEDPRTPCCTHEAGTRLKN